MKTGRGISIARMMGLVLAVGVALAAYRHPVFRSTLLPVSIAAILAVVILRSGRYRVTAGRLVGVVALELALPFGVATWINQSLWGYPFERPGVDSRIVDVREVKSVTQVETVIGQQGRLEFDAVQGYTRVVISSGHDSDQYYLLGYRVVAALESEGRMPANPPWLSDASVARLHALLDSTGSLEAGDPGYDHSKELRGFIVEAVGSSGQPLLFFGVSGREVSNDHYPYYEFLFEGQAHSTNPKLLSFRRFYYDVAGIEGLEWAVLFPWLSIPSLVLAIPVGGFAIWWGRRRKRPAWPVSQRSSGD